MFAILAALLTGVALVFALAPLIVRPRAAAAGGREEAFYRAQLADIARDVERGQLPAQEAAAARAEAARRLIAAHDAAAIERPKRPPSLKVRQVLAALALFGGPALAVGLYATLGAPELPDLPLSQRGDELMAAKMTEAVRKVEAHLETHPDDLRGWETLAPVYMRLGRFEDAVRAYREALRLNGDSVRLLIGLGEALVAASGGAVPQEAREAFLSVLAKDPTNPEARYYIAFAAELDGDLPTAERLYEELLADAPPGAAWAQTVRERLAAVKAGKPAVAPKVAANDGSDAPSAMIEQMVKGLADRLAAKGGTKEEWARLIRAYSVLKETDKAKAALASARAAYASDAEALKTFDALARELGIAG